MSSQEIHSEINRLNSEISGFARSISIMGEMKIKKEKELEAIRLELRFSYAKEHPNKIPARSSFTPYAD